MARQLSVFSIEARDERNQKRSQGGDLFLVTCRGASQIKVAVHDKGDGTYACDFRPAVSGTYYVAASLGGTNLPGSPWTIEIFAPNADAEKCKLTGDALKTVTAREPSSFEVEFVDALGNITHAEELDVFVVPRGWQMQNASPTKGSPTKGSPTKKPTEATTPTSAPLIGQKGFVMPKAQGYVPDSKERP